MTTPASRRILICDELHPAALEVFHARGFEPEVCVGLSEAELVETVPGAHALVVRSATKVTAPVIEAADELAVIGRAGVGVDNVDTRAATERGIVVMNTPTGNTTTTGELAIALLTAIARHIPRADRTTRGGVWKKKGLLGSELTGKTLGVIGLGRIGRVVAERALGLRMNVVASDPYLSKTGAGSPIDAVELLELDDVVRHADFLTLHVPLTNETRGLLSRERMLTMKPGARIINAARGGLIDEVALAELLDAGHIAGAALDVLAKEPPSADHPLVGREDVILTPHLGASSHEAQRAVAEGIAEQISTFFTDGVAHNAVNAPAVSAQTLKEIGHYIVLAEKMGAYLGQRLEDPVRKVEFTVSGEVAERDAGVLKLAFLASLLSQQGLDVGVNLVNAPVLAKERGIRILESVEKDTDFYTSQLRARVSNKGNSESHLVTGTVFGKHPRFVRVEGMHVDFDPSGHLLVTKHNDRPGVLGQLGTLLGDAGANIRRVELGPPTEQNDGLASAFLSLYEAPTREVIEAIRALESIESVKHLSL
ncbi:MAG: phosphoglycerate dehydrogenase [bacterium]|nr:phosphoglycerate dehydrogenase [bacterium]